MLRRTFLKALGLLGVGTVVAPPVGGELPPEKLTKFSEDVAAFGEMVNRPAVGLLQTAATGKAVPILLSAGDVYRLVDGYTRLQAAKEMSFIGELI